MKTCICKYVVNGSVQHAVNMIFKYSYTKFKKVMIILHHDILIHRLHTGSQLVTIFESTNCNCTFSRSLYKAQQIKLELLIKS